MALTADKAKAITDFLGEDSERAKKLFDMDPQDAAKEMGSNGLDVSSDDLIEFGSKLAKYGETGELSEDDLEDVAGGLGAVATVAIAYGIALGCGYLVGRLSKW